MKREKEFFERQYFPWWVRALTAILCIALFIYLYIETGNWDFVSLGVLALVLALILIANLKTVITQEGIYVKMIPFMWKFILYAWADIAEYKVEKYNPLLNTGGWGLKFRLNIFRRGGLTSYNIWGNIALKLTLNNGRKVWIGTQKKGEMQAFLEELSTENGGKQRK